MPQLLLTDEEQARVDAARAGVDALGVSHSAIGDAIGRARANVCGTLNGTIWSPGTLALIEELLGDEEAVSDLTSTGAGQKDQSKLIDQVEVL